VLAKWREHAEVARLLTPDAADESGRDYAIACAAVKLGCRDVAELAKLVSAARLARCPGDTKAVRHDYPARTARAALAGARHPDAAARLSDLLGLPAVGLHVIGAQTFGRGGSAIAHVHVSDGQTIVFEPLRNMGNPSRLSVELACSVGARVMPNKAEAVEVVALVHDLGQALAGTLEDEVAREDYGRVFLADARQRQVDMNDQADRWRAFCALKDANPLDDARKLGTSVAACALVLVDDAGTRYVPVEAFWEHVRRSGWSISPGALKTRMLSIGWQRVNERGTVKATQPGGDGVIVRAFYTARAGWEDQ